MALVGLAGCATHASPAGDTDHGALLVPAQATILRSDIPRLGGLSGIELSEDGSNLFSVSDRALIVRIDKAPPHKVLAIEPLGGLEGIPGRYRDVESLRRSPTGGWWVAFEGINRVSWYGPGWQGLNDKPKRQFLHGALRGLEGNRGIEALAALPDGRGLVIAEQSGEAAVVVFNSTGRVESRKTYRTEYPPVDAVALPDGGLLILTRTPIWPLPPTFVSRLEYVAPGWQDQKTFAGRPLFRLDHALPSENYEGMAIEFIGDETIRIWLVSDDNYSALQQTLLARVDLPRACLQAVTECRLNRITDQPQPSPIP